MNESVNDIDALKGKVREFCTARDWGQYHNPKDLAIGLVGESSELLEKFRYKTATQMDEMMKNDGKRKEIAEEVGDVFYSLLLFADKCDFDLSGELLKSLEKNEKKYPVSTSKGKNLKYNEE